LRRLDLERRRESKSAEVLTIQPQDERPSRGWGVPRVCSRWVNSGDERRVRFALKIMEAYENVNYVAPSGGEMERFVGVSRMTLSTWFREFVGEVKQIESQS